MSAAAEVYARPDGTRLDVYGITGTNGKTTTAYLVDGGLHALGRRTLRESAGQPRRRVAHVVTDGDAPGPLAAHQQTERRAGVAHQVLVDAVAHHTADVVGLDHGVDGRPAALGHCAVLAPR